MRHRKPRTWTGVLAIACWLGVGAAIISQPPATVAGKQSGLNGGEIVATSCSRGHVEAAITAAIAGDTVVVPAGTCTWFEGISFSKGIHLRGESPGSVTLVHSAGASYLLEITEDPSHVTEVSALRFLEGSATADAHVAVYGGGGRPVVIRQSYFETDGGLLRSIRWASNRGLVWGNEFYSNRGDDQGIVFVNGDDDSWTTPSTMGAGDVTGESNVYVEDNLFREIPLQALDPDGNSRVVIRHNLFDNSGMASHGADTSPDGTRHWEVYDNTFTFTNFGDCDGSQTLNLNYFFYIRGGTGVIADNVIPDIASCAWGDKTELVTTVQNIRRNAGPYPCWVGYPAPRQVGQSHDGATPITDPVYIWANSGGGIHAAVDYNPDECGNGETVGDYIQVGRDVVFAPKPGYQKYPYPHPLRGQIFADGFESGDVDAWMLALGAAW